MGIENPLFRPYIRRSFHHEYEHLIYLNIISIFELFEEEQEFILRQFIQFSSMNFINTFDQIRPIH
jgi:hypothetical protein